ncbi:MAG: hypothetical protein P2A85_24610 [Microcoleus anatoxicus]
MPPLPFWLVISHHSLVISYWLLVIGYWLLVIGYWLFVICVNSNVLFPIPNSLPLWGVAQFPIPNSPVISY